MQYSADFYVQTATPDQEIPFLHPTMKTFEITFVTTQLESTIDEKTQEYEEQETLQHREIKLEHSTTSASTKLARASIHQPNTMFHRFLVYDISSIDEITRDELSTLPDASILGAGINQLFPSQFTISFDESKSRASRIAQAIAHNQFRLPRDLLEETIPVEIIKLLQEQIIEESGFDNIGFSNIDSTKYRLLDVIEVIRDLPEVKVPSHPRRTPRDRFRLRRMRFRNLHSDIEEHMRAQYKTKFALSLSSAEDFDPVERHFRTYFGEKVLYLGPLRDEPKPLYPLESLANTTDVGFKGEHTAAVLDLNRHRYVDTIVPDTFLDSAQIATRKQQLGSAVGSWMSYLGVAENVSTSDLGKFGHELQVKTEGTKKAHDLTNVGVGVSQILPIVVMALLAERGSLLIFEQPELHLHPKVQARLGDFFLAISLLGKQCIVETHSEYLIDRFRRRIAEDQTSTFADLASVYFFEKSSGRTCVRKVEINEFGAIPDWPKDFFDQATEETQAILSAANAKRHKRKKT